MIEVLCSQCGKSYRVKEDRAGKRVRCPRGHIMVVPGEADSGASSARARSKSHSGTLVAVMAGVAMLVAVPLGGYLSISHFAAKRAAAEALAEKERADETEREAAQQAARREAERQALEEARLVAEAKAAAEKKKEVERIAAIARKKEEARLQAERELAEAKRKVLEEERRAKLEAERAAAEARERALWSPTKEEIEAAKIAFHKAGAGYHDFYDHWRSWFVPHYYYPKPGAWPGEKMLPAFGCAPAKLKDLPDLPFRFALTLSDPPSQDSDLKNITHLKNLAFLDLVVTKVTGEGLRELSHLPHLTDLKLYNPNLTNDDLRVLKELPSLSRLNISGFNVKLNSDAFAHLKQIKNLMALSVVNTDFKPECLVELRELKNLTAINMRFQYDKDGIVGKELSRHKSLAFFTGELGVGEKGLDHLPAPDNVTALTTGFLFDPSGQALKRFRNLRMLEFRTPVSDAIIGTTLHLRNLTTLVLNGPQITDKSIGALQLLPNLVYLRLDDTRVTAQGARELFKATGGRVIIVGPKDYQPVFPR